MRGGERNSILKGKAGILAVVTSAGAVRPGMAMIVEPTSWFEEWSVLR